MLSDIKYTIRSLLKTPGFTIVAVVTLALGIGATTAIFSIVNTVLLKPLPYAQPERLARICAEFPGMRCFTVSYQEYFYFRRELKSWQSIDAYLLKGGNMATGSEPSRVTVAQVTGGLFSSLGVAPAFGRAISLRDAELGAEPVAVISHGLWQRAFGGDRAVLGREILIDNIKHIVVGVMPKGFGFPMGKTNGVSFGGADVPDLWSAFQIDPAAVQFEGHIVNVLGRLQAGVAFSQAQAELDSLVKNKVAMSPGHYLDPKNHAMAAYGLQDDLVHGIRPALRMLFGAVLFLLLIACANVANLLLGRAQARQREIAVRGALGAGTWRLARQFATEGLVISVLGAALGMLLAHVALGLLPFADDVDLPRVGDIGIDSRVVLFAVAVGCLTGVIFGVVPLVHAVKKNLYGSIKTAGMSTTDAAGAQRLRQGLATSQIALALMLLVGTGLMLRAFWKVQEVDAGFSPEGVTTAFIELPRTSYPSGKEMRQFWATLQERLVETAGIESVSLSSTLPPVGGEDLSKMPLLIEGLDLDAQRSIPTIPMPQGTAVAAGIKMVSPGYFDTLKIHLAAGRLFDARDGGQAPKVAIVNQAMARAFWGDKSALGRRIKSAIPQAGEEWHTIVGVVADVKNAGIDKPTDIEFYLPSSQANIWMSWIHIGVRSRQALSEVVSAIRHAVTDIDPTLPLTQVRTMEEVVTASQSRPRLLTLLLTVFAGVALTLAAVGIYGVISYSVAQRTREFGIRMALGAQHRAVLGQVLKRGLLLTLCGLAVGLVGAFALTRFLSSFLFGITATDPPTFVVVSLLLGAIAILATYIPARRATKVDPLVALRAE